MKKNILIALVILIPIPLSIVGALTRDTMTLYAMIIVMAGIVGVIACTNIVPKNLCPLAIFSIGLGLLYQTTLISPYLVGTDIQSEYYYYLRALDGWDRTIPGNYNTALGVVLLAPFLTNVFHIDGLWIFKAVYPFLFSLAPVLLYFAFKGLMERKQAFLASFFFVCLPPFMLELIAITKLQLSGLCLSFVIFLLFYPKWSSRLKFILGILASFLLLVFHYSTGYVYLYIIGVGGVFLLIARQLKLGTPKFPLKVLVVFVAIVACGTVGYFGLIGSSMINPFNSVDMTNYMPSSSPGQTQEPLVLTALGYDFMRVGVEGKIFRVLQWLTEIFIAVGFVAVVFRARKDRKFPLEYCTLAGAGLLLILLCIFLPLFSRILNMTRFYQLAVYFIAPLFVIGGVCIFKPFFKGRVLPIITLGIIIPYFLFTSGFVFEVLKKPDISSIDIPYSIALSSPRIDIAAICTDGDWEALEWVSKNAQGNVVYADVHGVILMRGKVGLAEGAGIYKEKLSVSYLPLDLTLVPDDGWVFIREWNAEREEITYKVGVGLRESISYSNLGVDGILRDRPILYQSGQACIYGGKE